MKLSSMESVKIEKIKDLGKAAKELIDNFPEQRIFAFYGKMGAGKTTYIQAVCRYLGSTDNIISPTFALVNEYRSANSGSVYHMDFYRIKNLEEVFDIDMKTIYTVEILSD